MIALAAIAFIVVDRLNSKNDRERPEPIIDESAYNDPAYDVPASEETVAEVFVADSWPIDYDNVSVSMPQEHIGKNGWGSFLNRELNSGSIHVTGLGEFLEHPGEYIHLDLVLRPDGQLCGRYSYPGIVDLDVNGYIYNNGENIHLQLGHGSEHSEWRLYRTDGLQYNGKWGLKSKASRVTFTIND